jgi:predicted MFS family arabinose efflux permease
MSNPADAVIVHPPVKPGSGAVRQASWRLGALFATAYFVQGIGEPTAGLITQPVQSLLRTWHYSMSEAGWFWFFVSLPWSIKPIYGLLTDFVPIFGSRRQSYLVLTTAATTIGFFVLFSHPPGERQLAWFALLLLVPTLGVAFSDVVVDALMIERGQPLGLTGRLQSIQWSAMYGATILTGVVGGWLSQRGLQVWGFAICATATSVLLMLAIFFIRDTHGAKLESSALAARELWQAMRLPPVISAAAFLFLWNFNPFSTNIQYQYMIERLGFSEQFYGNLTSVFAVASVLASAAYGFYCRRVNVRGLVHLSITLGVLSTLAYWALGDATSAVVVTLVVGVSYMTGMLIQLDLAARACPPHVAGTIFALFMSLSNLSVAASGVVGGQLFDRMIERGASATLAFNVLVGIGAAFTAACWVLLPWLNERTFALAKVEGEDK